MKMHHLWHSAITALLLAVNTASVAGYYNYTDDSDDKIDSYTGGDDFIKYWTEYAVLPLKCITMNSVDVIVYAMYEKYYNHCADRALGTYMVDVPTFMTAYLSQLELNAGDTGADYESPDSSYMNCYEYYSNEVAVSVVCAKPVSCM